MFVLPLFRVLLLDSVSFFPRRFFLFTFRFPICWAGVDSDEEMCCSKNGNPEGQASPSRGLVQVNGFV